MSRITHTLLLIGGLLFFTALAFWPGLYGDFLFDDYPNIVSNPRIHLAQLDAESLKSAAGAYEFGPFGRPVATLSFAMNHYLGGLTPWGFKFTNLLVHLLNTLLVFSLVRRLLVQAGQAPGTRWAFAIALVWAIHPLQVSTVLYVVQRMEMLSLTFVLLALLTYFRGRVAQLRGENGWPSLLACVPLALLALLSKETGFLLPLFTLALELTVLGFDAADKRVTKALRWLYGVGAILGAALFVFVVLPPYLDPELFRFRGFTLVERLLSQTRALCLYLVQILIPSPVLMTFYYDTFPVSRSLLDPVSTAISTLVLAGLAGLAVGLRKRLPLFALGVFWFLASHALTSNVFPLELVFEHRNYFGLLGVVLAAVAVINKLRASGDDTPPLLPAGALLIGLLALTLIRSATWGNPFNLAMDLAAKSPESARASVDLGEQFMRLAGGNAQSPFYQMAKDEFERGAALPHASPLAEQALILLASSAGEPAKDAWWLSMIEKLQNRPLGPQEIMAVTGLLEQRAKLTQFDDRRFREAMSSLGQRTELPAHVHAGYGDYLLHRLQDREAARAAFVAAVGASKGDPDFAGRMIVMLISEGEMDIAQAALSEADRIGLALPGRIDVQMGDEPAPSGTP